LLVRCFSIAPQAASASSKVLNGEPNDLDRATASVNWTCGEYAAPPVVAVPVYYGVYAAGPVYYGGYANRSYITGRPTLFPRYYGW